MNNLNLVVQNFIMLNESGKSHVMITCELGHMISLGDVL